MAKFIKVELPHNSDKVLTALVNLDQVQWIERVKAGRARFHFAGGGEPLTSTEDFAAIRDRIESATRRKA
jgi:hypothetical protein